MSRFQSPNADNDAAAGNGADLRSPAARLRQAMRKNPEAFLLLAAGGALLMGARKAARAVAETSTQAETDESRAQTRRPSATLARRDVSRNVSRDRATQRFPLATAFEYMLDSQPLALGAFGAAAGAIVGLALPTTDAENSALGGARNRVAQAASKTANEQFSRLRAAAQAAGEKLKEEVASHGLTPDGLKDVAHEVVEAAKERAAHPDAESGDTSANAARAAHTG